MRATGDRTGVAQFLTFTVGGEEYAISLLGVREILEYGEVTRVPRTPDHVRGVINLRGRAIPVVDLGVRFGLPPSAPTKRSCVVIVDVTLEGARVLMGLVADAVDQVVELAPEEIEAPPSFGTRVDVAYLKGMGRAGPRFVLLLDVDRLLSSAETAETASSMVQGAAATALALLLLASSLPVRADEPIRDNSFLVEEAYNQERGVVQHINTFSRSGSSGDWIYTFTQEWPLHGERHQLGFTLPVQDLHASAASSLGMGDVALNYRYQAIGGGDAKVAFSPRASLLLPTGKSSESLGAGGAGLQANLPVSWTWGSRFVTHWNAGVTHTFSAHDAAGNRADTTAWSLAQSVVWLAHPKANLLVETAWASGEAVAGRGATSRSDALFVSPGLRFALDVPGGLQVVPGVAFPIGVGPSRGDRAVFFYLSLEHPFRAMR
jgi:chemotaxis signal transduction protein